MKIITNIIDLLFRPDTFFSRISQENESLLVPALIVLLGSITTIVTAIIYSVSFPNPSFDATIAGFSSRIALDFPYKILGSLLFWATASVSIYAVSKLFSGTGSLKCTFQNIGYSVLPIALCASLRELLGTLAMITLKQSGGYSLEAYTNNPFGNLSTFLSSNDIFLVLVLWTGYLCVRGIMNAHRIPMSKAIVAIIIGFIMVIFVNLIAMARLGI